MKPLSNLAVLDLKHCGLLFAHLGYLPDQIISLNLNDNHVQELSLNRYFPQLKHLQCRSNRLPQVWTGKFQSLYVLNGVLGEVQRHTSGFGR